MIIDRLGHAHDAIGRFFRRANARPRTLRRDEGAARMHPDVALARRIALVAHAGQTDKLGRDYGAAHLAPIAAMAAIVTGGNPRVEAAAWLHDTIEDTPLDAAELRHQGVDPRTIEAVEAVSKRPGESYPELIRRACADPDGCWVKLADNGWNIACNVILDETDPAAAARLLQKYLPAREALLVACGITIDDARYQQMIARARETLLTL